MGGILLLQTKRCGLSSAWELERACAKQTCNTASEFLAECSAANDSSCVTMNSNGSFPVYFTLLLIGALLFVGARCAVSDTQCANLAASANCRFYDDCVEAKVPCGPQGYAEGYGKKYCVRFGEPQYYNNFNEQGKQWVDKVRVCLMEMLLPLLKRQNLTCEEIMDYAFNTHPGCYVSAGFCKDIASSLGNMDALFRTFDLKDVFSKRFWDQVLKTAESCV